EHGRVPLPMRMRAAEYRDGAIRIEANVHAIVEDAAELDVVADRTATQFAGLFRGRLALLVTLPVRHIEALVEQADELAGIVAVPSRRVVREFVRRNEIDAADLGNVHADLLRRMLDHALGEISGLRPSGA